MYPKGIETKRNIFMAAKQAFYENGYKKATMQTIAKLANVPVSLVNYHFQHKSNIVQMIFREYIEAIAEAIREATGDKIESYLQFHSTSQRVYYEIILNNKNNLQFCYEWQCVNSNYKILFDRVVVNYRNLLDEFKIYIPESRYKAIITADFGARNELLLRYYTGELILTVEEFADIIIANIPSSFGVDSNILDSALYKSMTIVREMDLSRIRLLV